MRALVVVIAACSGVARHPAPSVTARLPIGGEVDVVSLDDDTFVFDGEHVRIVRGGAVVASARAPARWTGAATIPAPDQTRWVVGIANGSLWRVTSAGELEAIGERLGLGDAQVLAIDGSRGTFAVGLANGVAASRDAHHVMHFAGEPAPFVAAAHDRIAVGRDRSVEVFDLARNQRTVYPADGVSSIAFLDASTSRARLAIETGTGVFVERGGALRRVSTPSALRQTVVAGSRIWMLGHALVVLDDNSLVTVLAEVAPRTRIHAATAGGVWVSTDSRLVRYALAAADDRSWQRTVAPVFQRGCAKCHLPAGSADVDLSTSAAWLERSDSIRQALRTRTMPPSGNELSDADRRVLERWLDE